MPQLSSNPPVLATLVLAASCLAASAQTQTKPSAAIPFPPMPVTQPAPVPPDATLRQPVTHPAQVHYANGRLAVVADNSSLNQILRDISRETGIKITGGIAEERVFGSYGPADPSRILATLLDGTGSNILLIDGAGPASRELILTPRTGGITPPSPSGAFGQMNAGADESDLPPEQRARRFGGPDGFNPAQPNNNPGAVPAFNPGPLNPGQSNPSQAAPIDSSAATTPSNDTTQQQSPNGVKTPQQIYDQLIKLQQQQQQTKPQ